MVLASPRNSQVEEKCVDLSIEILRTEDGVIAMDIWKEWNYNEFWWREGNASCDCNRELFFCNARNEEDPGDL